MTEITHHKFSLFRLEKPYRKNIEVIGQFSDMLITPCFEYINTFDSLEQAKSVEKQLKYKSIILPSY